VFNVNRKIQTRERATNKDVIIAEEQPKAKGGGLLTKLLLPIPKVG
jgi:hypothetical protein